MKRRTIILLLFSILSASGQAFASAKDQPHSNEKTSIYGTDCENIKGDFKSSVRARAIDKASFLAVSTIPDLTDFRKNMPEHDFNVLVYGIVDDLIDDLAVKPIKQNEDELCVEITGTVRNDSIYKAVGDYIAAKEKEPTINLQPAVTDSPPETVPPVVKVEPKSLKGRVFVPPLVFYNNTHSAQYAQVLKNLFADNQYLELVDNQETADYIVSSKVLRAKVEQISEQNSRLQMIVSVDLEITRDQSHLTENQNRFVLFSKNDNEQQIAADLMRGLLEKAGRSILAKAEKDASLHQAPSSGAIITPASGTIKVIKEEP